MKNGWKKTGLKIIFFLVILTVSMGGSGQAFAEEETRWKLGIQGGWSFDNDDESFNQYDFVADYNLPWQWSVGESSRIGTMLTMAVGALDGGGDTGVIGSLGLALTFGSVNFPLELRIGSALTLMSEDEYGDEDFGGPFQFTSHIGLEYRFLENWSASARYQHMSNLDIYSRNPGLNLVVIGIGYHF